MTLGGLQIQFSDFLRDRSDEIRARVRGGPHADVDTLLGIYRNAYTIRLVKILRDDFDRLHRFAGDAMFDRLATDCLAAHPSRSFSVRGIGAFLPDFLAGSDPWRNNPELAQLAGLEWAQVMAFDAADAPLAQRADLTSIAPADWPCLTFAPHASVQRVVVSPDIYALWQSLGRDEAPGVRPAQFAPDAPHLVWRLGLDVKLRPLEPDEAEALDVAIAGKNFSAICELLGNRVGFDRASLRAAELLDRWVTSGMIGEIGVMPTGSA